MEALNKIKIAIFISRNPTKRLTEVSNKVFEHVSYIKCA